MALEPDSPPVRPITLFALPEAWSEQPVPGRQYLPVLGALLMLLAGDQVWAQGLFVLCVGLALWRKPPRYSLSRQTDAFSLVAAAVVLLTFLPYFIYRIIPLRWVKQGRWRGQLDQADITSAFFYTPQPLLTLEIFMLLLSVLALIALLIHAPLYNAQRWRFALLLAGGLAVLGALGLLGGAGNAESAVLPALGWAAFPNFGTAMAIGSLLAFALMVAAMRERWIAGIVLMAVCLCLTSAALVRSGSGLWTWAALAAIFWAMMQIVRKRKIHGLIRASAIIAFITAATLVILGHTEGSRWILNNESSSDRIVRYYDSATVVMQQSAMGVGLGNFKYIFPFYQSRSLGQGEITAPGNDWLLISVEGGIFGLSAFGLLCCALFISCFGKSRRQSAPIRLAALCALVLFFVGSVVQSPGHYLGTVLLGVVCLQIARPSRGDDTKRSLMPRWLWKLEAGVLILAGVLWLSASLLNGGWQSDIAAAKSSQGLAQAIEDRDIEAVNASAALGLRFTPLAADPYMERGRGYILINRNLSEGKSDFNRALVLIPGRADMPLHQGVLWLPHSIHEAEQSFRHALERHSDDPDKVYEHIVAVAGKDRYFQQPLARLSQINSRMRFAYLIGIPQNQFTAALAEELRTDGSMQRFTEAQRRDLIERWAKEGNTRTAIQYLEQHPDSISYPWYIRGLALAKLGSLKEASDLFSNSLPRAQIPLILVPSTRRTEMPLAGFSLPEQPDNEPTTENAFGASSLNHLQAAALLQKQLDTQQWEAAQQTATRLLTDSDSPAYAVYWSAWLHHRAGNYREAWPLLEQYARHYLDRRWEERDAELRGELMATPSLSSQAFERWGQITPEPSN